MSEKEKPAATRSTAEDKLRAFHEESAIGNVVDVRLIKRLVPYLGPQRGYLVGSLALLVALSLLGLVRPLL
ncbi:ABC transporter ATP-binding protein, partial [bacterium]